MKTDTFFNKAIYKANLKRFWVGSVLYLAILFLIFTITQSSGWFYEFTATMYMYTGSCVSVVVAALVYGFIHNKKQAILTHSMPVSKLSNYISTLLSAFTLMGAPLVIMCIVNIAVSGDVYMSLCVTFYGLLCLFVAFAVATLAATLTGVTWMVFVLYIASIILPSQIYYFVDSLIQAYANGYVPNTIANFENLSMHTLLFSQLKAFEKNDIVGFDMSVIRIVIIVSVVMYVISFLLYSRRKLEDCESPAGFKFLGSLLKYAVTIYLAMLWYDWFRWEYVEVEVVAFLIMTFAAYFGTEMILKKKIKVWGAYKGYIAFVVIAVIISFILGKTSIFGYETYIPDKEKVTQVYLESMDREGYFYDEECIDCIIEKHGEFIKQEEGIKVNSNLVNIRYYLGDKKVSRRYWVATDEITELYRHLYESEDFKSQYDGVFKIDTERIHECNIISNTKGHYFLTNEEAVKLIECMRNDVLNNSFDELFPGMSVCKITVTYLVEDTEDSPYNWRDYDAPDGYHYEDYSMEVNYNHSETVLWLMENGYAEAVAALWES